MPNIFRVLLASFFFINLHAAPIHEEMKQQFDIFKSIFETRYALLDWKKEHFGVSLEDEVQKAKTAIDAIENPTIPQFQFILKRFFNAFHDYHLDVFFYSTGEAELPFVVKPVKEKYFVAYVDKKKLSRKIPLCIGDELLFWNGVPPEEAVQLIAEKYLCGGNRETDKALAAHKLTHRIGKLGYKIPTGRVKATFLHHTTGEIKTYYIPWKNNSEEVVHPSIYPFALVEDLFSKHDNPPAIEEAPNIDNAHVESLGGRKSFVPYLGPITWESPKDFPFHSYLFELPDSKKGAYIRIPHFKGGPHELKYFENMIEYYELHTDILVIDLTNNSGGFPLYSDAIASMLSPTPLVKAKHKLSLTYEELTAAVTNLPLLHKADTLPALQKILDVNRNGLVTDMTMKQLIINYYTFIVEQWTSGKKISDPFPIYGIDTITPHPKFTYSKPILVLTNCLSFSAADLLPALLQDNHRAIIFGEKTAGAGGLFQIHSHINPFGIRRYHITISMALRDNLQPVENLGVEPDVLYYLTDHDLQCHYENYKKNVNKILEELIHGTYPSHR